MNQCKYETIYETRLLQRKARKCNKPTQGQWCKEHAYVAEVLQLAKALDYPRYTIAYLDSKPVYTLYGGQANWEAYAARHPKRRHGELCSRMRQELSKRLEAVA